MGWNMMRGMVRTAPDPTPLAGRSGNAAAEAWPSVSTAGNTAEELQGTWACPLPLSRRPLLKPMHVLLFPVNLPEPLPLQLRSFSGQDRTALLPLTWAVAPSTCSADEKPHPLQPPLHDIRPSPPSSFTHTCCPSSWGLQAPGSLGPHWQQGQGFKKHLLSGAMVTPKPRLLLRAMSGSIVLPQSGFELMAMAHSNTKGHRDCNLWPYWCLKAMPPQWPC